MRQFGEAVSRALCVVVAVASIAGCAASDSVAGSVESVASTVESTEPPATITQPPPDTEPPTTPAETVPATTAEPAPLPPMPDVVCMNLQAAQDYIQTLGIFFSRSEDATGAGRSQVIDSNWIVVGQFPEPGTPFDELDAVLYVVKYGETPNPC